MRPKLNTEDPAIQSWTVGHYRWHQNFPNPIMIFWTCDGMTLLSLHWILKKLLISTSQHNMPMNFRREQLSIESRTLYFRVRLNVSGQHKNLYVKDRHGIWDVTHLCSICHLVCRRFRPLAYFTRALNWKWQ